MIDTVMTTIADTSVSTSAEKSTEKVKEQSKPLDIMKTKDIKTTPCLFHPINNDN